jgi:hypothetical protein
MSYDVDLINESTNEPFQLDEQHGFKGGTYAVGGSNETRLNITYNYAPQFKKVLGFDGIRTLIGMNGGDSVGLLEDAINNLNDDVDDDYWKATEGNARKSLEQLMVFAKSKPEGVWMIY